MKSLDEIEAEVDRIAALIGADHGLLPTLWLLEPNGHFSHISKMRASAITTFQLSGGTELDRWTTPDPDELLHAVFRSVTFVMASEFELHHRIAEQDSRRRLFEKQIELISILSAGWARRLSMEKERLLKIFTFDDAAGMRVALTRELRDQGRPGEEAWRIACEKYPHLRAGASRMCGNLLRQLRELS